MIKLYRIVYIIGFLFLGNLYSNSQDIYPIINSGNDYLNEKEYTLASDQFDMALVIDELNAEALLGRARALIGLKQHNKAITALLKGINNNDSVPDLFLELGKIHFRFENYEDASDAFFNGLSQSDNHVRLNYYYGATLFFQDDYITSNQYLEKAVNLGDSSGYVHYYLSEIALSDDSLELAFKEIDLALTRNKNVPRFHLGKGNVYYAQEEYLWASLNYSTALSMNPNYMNARKARAKTYMKSEKFILALSDLRTITKEEPDLVDAWTDKGTCEYALEKYDDAIESYTTSFDLSSDYTLINKRALAYKAQGDFDSAIEDLRFLVASFPSDASMHFRLANMYQLNSNYQAAHDEYMKCLEIDKNNVLAWNNKAVVLFHLGKIEHACDIWKQIIEKSQDSDFIKMAEENKKNFCE